MFYKQYLAQNFNLSFDNMQLVLTNVFQLLLYIILERNAEKFSMMMIWISLLEMFIIIILEKAQFQKSSVDSSKSVSM